MTNKGPIRQRLAPDPWLDPSPAGMPLSSAEEEAVRAGVRAGDAALVRFEAAGVLTLFVERRGREELVPRLEALRTYAELRRVLLAQGHDVPAASLFAAGYTAAEIARFDATIAAAPLTAGPRPATGIPASRTAFG